MSLLLGTDIDKQINDKIRGKIARIGGRVEQLVTYKNCTVEDINLMDGGYGAVRKLQPKSGIPSIFTALLRYSRQEIHFIRRGYSAIRDRKTVVIDLHEAYKRVYLINRYDCAISSNVIEHTPNPVWFLLNCYFVTKEVGYQYHAIPYYKYTFDVHRKPTGLEHMVKDFEEMTGMDDTTHNEDYVQSAVVKHGWQREFHNTYPIRYPYIHFHVFDENNTRELMEFIFEDVTNDISKTEKFGDNVVIFRNRLNDAFQRDYGGLTEKYKAIGYPSGSNVGETKNTT